MENGQPTNRAMQLAIGMRLPKDAYNEGGHLLLRAGERIETAAQLERLLRIDVRFGAEMSAELYEQQKPGDEASPPTLEELAEDLFVAVETKSTAVQSVASIFDQVESSGVVDISLAQEATLSLLESVREDPGAMLTLTQLKNVDEYTFTHCVNVGIFALHIAIAAGYAEHVEDIGVGALLHDVGKTRIPLSIVNKPGPLDYNERLIINQHSGFGYEILQKSGFTNPIALSIVLDHHEYPNGTGYPNGKSGKELSPFAMIACIADVYDALTTDRPYRKAMSPRDALLLMNHNMAPLFDPKLLRIFTTSIGYFPVGSSVELNDNQIGVVVKNNVADPLRPVIEVLNPIGLASKTIVDLKEKQQLFIVRFVDSSTIFDGIETKAA